MHRRLIFTLPIAVAALALTTALPTTAAARAKIGIADQRPAVFADPLFKELGVRHARISIPWDLFKHPFAAEEADVWLTSARAAGVTPLVTFQRSRVTPRQRPSVAAYTSAIKRFRVRYPWIKEYSAWNEPNLEDSRRPRLIAGYYEALKRNCRGCTVLAADLLDLPSTARWVKQFNASLKGPKPKRWALHNYVSANRFSASRTRAVLRSLGGSKVWITEVGGLVARRNRSTIKLPAGVSHAAKVTSYMLKTWGTNPQIQRIYVYQWRAGSDTDTWDSGLVAPDGTERPALGVLRAYLKG